MHDSYELEMNLSRKLDMLCPKFKSKFKLIYNNLRIAKNKFRFKFKLLISLTYVQIRHMSILESYDIMFLELFW